MAAGEEPAVEASVQDHGDGAAIRVEDEAGGGDVTGCKLLTGKGLVSFDEEHADQFDAFFVTGEGIWEGEREVLGHTLMLPL